MSDAKMNLMAALGGALLGGIIGFIGSYFSYRWNRKVSLETTRITVFNKAAADFNAALLDEIIFFKDTTPGDISVEMEKRKIAPVIPGQASINMRHRKAMIIFRPYIDKSDLAGFDAAWSKYHEWTLYYGDENNKENEYDFKSHLNNLLEYANPK